MKKLFKTLTAVTGAALAIAGVLFLYQKFFRQDEEWDEDFDDEELFDTEDEDDEDSDIIAFDSEEEIFEEEPLTSSTDKEAISDMDITSYEKETR